MENSKIEWTTHTMNPVHGCARVSEGCLNCYAERASHRNTAVLGVWGPNGTRVVASEAKWREPYKWSREAANGPRPRVFCASIADVFEDYPHPLVDAQGRTLRANQWYPTLYRGVREPLHYLHVRGRLGDMIRNTFNIDWLLLTKRPQNALVMMHSMFGSINGRVNIPANVWVGATVENQQRAEERCPELVKIRAAGCRVVFMSCEPLLSGLDVRPWLDKDSGINWTICGGESGAASKIRPMELMWARTLRDQCGDAGVPFFMKQIGVGVIGLTYKGKGVELDDMPEDLRVREYPSVTQ